MTLDDRDIAALTFLACKARPFGARRWDEAGTAANIAKVRGRNLADVILATIRAAADRDCESPGVIPTNGAHWREQLKAATFTPSAAPTGTRCTVCGQVEGFHTSGKQVGHEHSPPREKLAADVIHGAVSALRDAIEPTEEATVPKTLDDLAERDEGLKARVDAVRAQLPTPPTREPASSEEGR